MTCSMHIMAQIYLSIHQRSKQAIQRKIVITNSTYFLLSIFTLLHFFLNKLQSEQVSITQVVNNMRNTFLN